MVRQSSVIYSARLTDTDFCRTWAIQPIASHRLIFSLDIKAFDIGVLMTYHMPYDKEVKKYDNINSIRGEEASIQSCGRS